VIKKYETSYRYVQLLWEPKVGDRVIFEGQKTLITKIDDEKICHLEGIDRVALPYKLTYRPTPTDVLDVLKKLSIYSYSQLDPVMRKVKVGVRCNKGVVHLAGNPFKVLSDILNLRVVDLNINNSINQAFERANRNPLAGQGIRINYMGGDGHAGGYDS
jgi:hypothetical protein